MIYHTLTPTNCKAKVFKGIVNFFHGGEYIMDIIKAKVFIEISKLKNFTLVSKVFNYTPSNVSHLADAIEQELGLKLFKRTNKGVILTKDAEKMLPFFEGLIESDEKLTKKATSILQSKKEEIKIATYASIANSILPELLSEFKKEFPNIKTTIEVSNEASFLLENASADVSFIDEKPSKNFKSVKIMEDTYDLVCPKGCFKEKKTVNINDIYSFTYIKTWDNIIDGYLDYSKFKEIISLTSSEDNSCISMIEKNIGISIMPRLITKNHTDKVDILKIEPEISRVIQMVYKNDDSNDAKDKFCSFVIDKVTKNKG